MISLTTYHYGKTAAQIEQECLDMAQGMQANDVQMVIKERFHRWGNIYIHEFTYGDSRIDCLLLNTEKRLVRGFEIKCTKQDFKNDEKWQGYTRFCSSLSIACPWGLIGPDEVDKPYGLLWVSRNNAYTWKRKPKNFIRRDCLAWTWQYLRIIETEFKRIAY